MINKLSGRQLACGNSTTKREEHYFYATNPETLKMFYMNFGRITHLME